MLIGGFQKFSLIDYPGKICAVVFTQGCNFRCSYCHNPELVKQELFSEPILEEKVLSFLEGRKGKLDGVAVTGGEPLLQSNLEDFLTKIKQQGYLIKLDTNGSFPEKLEGIIKRALIDYVAMDVKAPLEKYEQIIQQKIEGNKIMRSINLIMNSGINYEFRTTVVKSQLTQDDILEIGKMIKGAKLYVLQKFVSSKALEPAVLKEITYTEEEFAYLKKTLKNYVLECLVR